MAQRRLVEAKKFLDAQKKEDFYAEVSRALWGYVSDKLGLPPSDLSVDAVRSSLQSRGVNDEVSAKLASTIKQCEFARFAPTTDGETLNHVYEEAVKLISSVEDQL